MKSHRILRLSFLRAVLMALLWSAFALAHGQTAATVTQIAGMVVETDTAGRSRVLAMDSAVASGSVLRTAADSHVRLKFDDGTDIVLRPTTEFRIDKFRFEQARPADDSFAVRLIKGGFRQVTGLLAKRNPHAMDIRAATATIGIRGTDFAVRMCEDDCGADAEAAAPQSAPAAPVARLLALQGSATAREKPSARERSLAAGAALYRGDVVATAAGDGHAALYFRDGTRISLAGNSVLAVEDYEFDAANPADGRASLALRSGGARVRTGAIGKLNPDHFVFHTPTASISPRGTWWDVVVSTAQQVVETVAQTAEQAAQAVGNAADQAAQAVQGAAQSTGKAIAGAARQSGKALHEAAQTVGHDAATAASGATAPVSNGDASTTEVTVLEGAAIIATINGSARIDPTSPGVRVIGDGMPLPASGRVVVGAPEPARFDANPTTLFGAPGGAKRDAGVYVEVHDGVVSLAQAGSEIVLVKGEVGFADMKNNPPQTIDSPPPILRHDKLLGRASLGMQGCTP